MIEALRFLGAVLGVAGALLNACPWRKFKLVGFVAWSIGNAALLLWSMALGFADVALMYGLYFVISLVSIWTHRRDP